MFVTQKIAARRSESFGKSKMIYLQDPEGGSKLPPSGQNSISRLKAFGRPYSQPLPLMYSLITPIAMISLTLPSFILNNSDMGMLFG